MRLAVFENRSAMRQMSHVFLARLRGKPVCSHGYNDDGSPATINRSHITLWEPHEDITLRAMWRQGFSQAEIARALNRGKGSVASRIKTLNLQRQNRNHGSEVVR